jgi:hypothetical protein
MNDSDYNHLMGNHEPPSALTWVVLVVGIIAFIFCLSVYAHASECGVSCTGSRWVLHVDGEPIEVGEDLTKDECIEIATQIDPGAPFSDIITCVEEEIQRTDL